MLHADFNKMKNSDPIIAVSNLTVKREANIILDDINWQVMPGEQWVILGSNGSGKTTLLNALNAYITPTSGEIEVCGSRFGSFDWRDLRQSIGIVSNALGQRILEDEPCLMVVVSGRRSEFNTWGRTPLKCKEEAASILDRMGLGYLVDREWRFLSQGERQRTLIARALMTKYKLLILDEPCSGMDPVARERFLQFLRRLLSGEFGAVPSVALVTHHVEEITPEFSHALLLKNGKAVTAGPIGEALTQKNLSEAFDAKLSFRKTLQGYRMSVLPD
jgi:iron complex transport system ATP-binding protein